MEVIRYFNLLMILLFGLILTCLVAFFYIKKKKTLPYLVLFSIFSVYIGKVLDYTLFQFQSLIVLKFFMPQLMLRGETVEKSMNLIPLLTLTSQDLQTSLLNILLLVPFGFGLPFITTFRMKRIVIIGVLFSISIELLQLISGLVAHITFRVADINDVIFNSLGVTVGYLLFVGFIQIYRQIITKWKISSHSILRYVADRPQVKK